MVLLTTLAAKTATPPAARNAFLDDDDDDDDATVTAVRRPMVKATERPLLLAMRIMEVLHMISICFFGFAWR